MSGALDGTAAWASSLMDFIALLGGKGSLVALTGFLAAGLMTRCTASARHLVWTATLCGLLLLPLASAVTPPLGLPLLPGGSGVEAGAGPGAGSLPGAAARVAAERPGSARWAPPAEAPSPARRATSPLAPLAAIYLAGCLVTLLYFAAGVAAVRRLTRTAEPLSGSGGWASSAVGRSRARFLVTRSLRAPVAWGWLRPVVLLPAEASDWSARERRHALLHELAHVERRDWATTLLARFACCVCWFHPLVWLAARRQALEAERACDDRVLAAGADATDYAGQLLSLVRSLRAGTGCPAAVSLARRSHLEHRIRSILDPERRRKPMRPIARCLVFLLAGLPAALVGAVTLVPAAAEEAPAAVRASDPLVRAAAEGELERVEELIAAGADVNRVVSGEDEQLGRLRTPLATAARAGHLEIARALLAAGAEIDRAPVGDATALIEAAGRGHVEIVELLLDWRADADRAVPGDGSPLIAAARGGSLEIVELLLAAGADADRAVPGDGSPLIAAVRGGHREIVDRLLAAGADPNRAVPGDGSPLQSAAESGNAAVLEALLAVGADVEAEVAGEGSALIAAARAGRLEVVRRLVEGGADVDRVVPGDENALIQAAAAGRLEVVRYLIEQGADVGASVVANGREVRTPLSQARRGGHAEVVELLIAAGAVE